MTERDRRISDQLVRLIQIVFGLVLAQSLLLFRGVILDPLTQEHWVATLALFTVYVTTVLSWIDWHITMEMRPYNFNPRNHFRATEQIRLGLDLVIVILYAYLLFTIEKFVKAPDAWIGQYLGGFVAVFTVYLMSGYARRRAHGRLASNPGPILFFGLLYLALYLAYDLLHAGFASYLKGDLQWINGSAVVGVLFLMLGYRFTRRRLTKRRQDQKARGLIIGIDVDGVLANQIHGILPRIRARLGIDLRYEDVTDWRLPLGGSDIAKEITMALEDPDYVMMMPVHDGARDVADELYKGNRIIMITSRPLESRGWTLQWLENNGFTFDEVINVKEQNKSFYGTDVLIDDYIGNIEEYLAHTNGTAILVDQPWNRKVEARTALLQTSRLHVVKSIREVPRIIRDLRGMNGSSRRAAPTFPIRSTTG